MQNIKVVAMDLDGTITQHKSPISAEHKAVLERLSKKYKLLMVGAGQAARIFNQLDNFPLDIIGNYGMQYSVYNSKTKSLDIVKNICVDCDKEEITKKVNFLRRKFGFESYIGENVEFHPSGCVTIPILGTAAPLSEKLAFDPDKTKRKTIYNEVVKLFPKFHVFIGGSSSFDMAPKPYNKYYALDLYCKENGILHSEAIYIGDDYKEGGNDHSVYASDFNYIEIDDYRDFKSKTDIL